MKKLWLGGTTGLALIGAANAADLGTRPVYKAPPPVVAPLPVFTWTGCYIGGHLGGGWGRKDVTDPDENFAPPGATVQIDPSGFLGGGQVGCDFQFTPSWVFGVEGTASWGDIHGSVDESALFTAAVGFPGNTGTATFSEKTNFIATVTGRLGFAWDRWLIYGKGGVAWDHDSYRFQGGLSPTIECIVGPFFCPDNFNQTATENRTGWTLGAGLEWAFWGNWSGKLEYQHFDFGSKRVTLVAPDNGPVPVDIKQRIETLKLGINYRFGWDKTAAPVVARY